LGAASPEELPDIEYRDGKFNVMNTNGYDEATWIEVYKVARD
jgi:hypothetical protein